MAISAQNEEVPLLTSATRTSSYTSPDLQNLGGTKIVVVVNVTSAGTGQLTLNINGKDSVSGSTYNLLSSTAITTNSTNRYIVANDATATLNVSAKDYLPSVFQIQVIALNANPVTYSVGYNLLRG